MREHFCHIIRVADTASTNSYLVGLSALECLPEWSVVITERQTHGRGQGDHSWESEPGANLTFSVLFFPVYVPAAEQFILSKMIALAVFDFVSGFVSDVSVKWPNDLYVGDRKIAGILMENFIGGAYLNKTIAGIGLNINQERFVSDAFNPVSLRQLTGMVYGLEDCFYGLLACIASRYRMMSEETELLHGDYLRHLYRLGKTGRYCADGVFFDAVITGVNRYGMLEMVTATGEELTFGFHEVKFI
jgi:BirA family biotin operon repressor/biotin-[acetyl-CoA-carboxylase] ligase